MPADDRAHGDREPRLVGYFRIKGERKLGHTVAATTIRFVLLRAGISPSGRRAKLSWKQFLAAQAQTLVVADFLSVDTVFSSSASTSLSICTWPPGAFCWPLARPTKRRRGWLSKPATWPGRWKRKGSS